MRKLPGQAEGQVGMELVVRQEKGPEDAWRFLGDIEKMGRGKLRECM